MRTPRIKLLPQPTPHQISPTLTQPYAGLLELVSVMNQPYFTPALSSTADNRWSLTKLAMTRIHSRRIPTQRMHPMLRLHNRRRVLTPEALELVSSVAEYYRIRTLFSNLNCVLRCNARR